VVDCNLIRDKVTGKPKGFCFLAYEDQKSTILSIDNMCGAKVLGRVLRVDHADRYRRPKLAKKMDDNDDEKVFDEQDEDYDTRRKRIWDYHLYAKQDMDNQSLSSIPAAPSAEQSKEGVIRDRVLALLAQKKAVWEAKRIAQEQGASFSTNFNGPIPAFQDTSLSSAHYATPIASSHASQISSDTGQEPQDKDIKKDKKRKKDRKKENKKEKKNRKEKKEAGQP